MLTDNEWIFLLITNALILLVTWLAVHGWRDREQQLLKRIMQAQDEIMRSAFGVDATLQLMVEKLQSVTGATGAVIELVEGDCLVYRATGGALAGFIGKRIAFAGSLSGQCIETGRVHRSDDTERDPRVNRAMTRATNIRSMVVAPLFHEGKTIGVVKVASSRPRAFNKRSELCLQLLSSMIGPAIVHEQDYAANQALLAERSHLALHDLLTGLPNRAYFMETLPAALRRTGRSEKAMALLLLDLDGFKQINDTLGHQAGDAMLQALGERLRQVIRGTDFTARLGGDEFTIILENLSRPPDDLPLIAGKIIAAISQPYALPSGRVEITTSIGIAISAYGTEAAETLIKAADDALYAAKRNGKNCFSLAPLLEAA